MRVLMISEHASPLALAGSTDAGGQNIYVDNIARQLAADGHHVDVLTRRDDPGLPAVVPFARGARVWHVDAGPPNQVPKEKLMDCMPDFAAKAWRMLRAQAPYDVIHANFFMSGWVGLQLRARLRAPLVTTFHALGLVRRAHQGAADEFPPARIAIEQQLVASSDRVIAECPQDRHDLQHLYGAVPRRIRLVPCGVDTQQFRPGARQEARQRLGLQHDEFIVLQLGRLVPRKGIDNVIQAMALVPAEVPARLVVVGGGSEQPDPAITPEIGRLQAVAASAGVAHRVTFVGRRGRDALRDWYVAADVFVTTPWYEPFGITPLEAMACGTPVIGSDVGGVRYTVQDGITGFLVPPKDPAAVAERLMTLQRQPLLARALGHAGVARVQAAFTWDHVARQLAGVYAQLQVARPERRERVRPRPSSGLLQAEAP
ncbi:glycosyl transferase family 1 [Hydrogenophaga sp. A37]|nr:glycosyl transferase family 1 [Hydrogenophaga sp. A37]